MQEIYSLATNYLRAKCHVQSESSIQVLSRVLVKNIFSLNFSVHQMMRRMPWPSALRALIPRILFCCCPMSHQCFLHCLRAEHSSSRPACRPRLVNRFRDCRKYLEQILLGWSFSFLRQMDETLISSEVLSH